VLRDPQPDHDMMIEELNLSGTGITIRSLRTLAPIIQLSGTYLRDVDLSNNKIRVISDQDVMDWEEFLDAFKKCKNMKRLVLSQNDFSGQLAFETMARVYSRHPQLDPDVISPLDISSADNGGGVQLNGKVEEVDVSSPSRSNEPKSSRKPCGLRSIPYIVLQDVKINMYGALWLSYIVEKHPKPEKLMGAIKPGPLLTVLADYRRTKCSGIIYKPNRDLGKKAQDLLELTEKQRSLIHIRNDTHVQALT
jgi:hypothetical protein